MSRPISYATYSVARLSGRRRIGRTNDDIYFSTRR